MECVFFFQAEGGIRDLVRSRGLGDVYKRQGGCIIVEVAEGQGDGEGADEARGGGDWVARRGEIWLLYTSDAADERSSVDLGGTRIIKKNKQRKKKKQLRNVTKHMQSQRRTAY